MRNNSKNKDVQLNQKSIKTFDSKETESLKLGIIDNHGCVSEEYGIGKTVAFAPCGIE